MFTTTIIFILLTFTGIIHSRSSRDSDKINIKDGIEYEIKETGTTYKQYETSDSKCKIEYDGKMYKEDDTLTIKGKYYKVEECHLIRAYHACGPNVLFMFKIVCRLVEQYTSNRRRRAIYHYGPKVITQACCENVCTIAEMTRYCLRS
ncbi:unnamed protein product [Didymodactylos carnosus]|uniref:Uncharacterized protein n=1 Tax=Didymodactylos carnosus TaxID=1234261 RepID=A0A815GCC4_9BILA|nr:unnamed protein product [Didymodactylos carnosus]CAF1336751.1 unnamed protein product [Didymodactylos carnosus]CAF3675268.1 unnamed protein product [Didymodactylos carnosus]CAF4194518.1 unnamed protein product [Didymodactylos carnosus]